MLRADLTATTSQAVWPSRNLISLPLTAEVMQVISSAMAAGGFVNSLYLKVTDASHTPSEVPPPGFGSYFRCCKHHAYVE